MARKKQESVIVSENTENENIENETPVAPSRITIGKYTVDAGIPMPVDTGKRGRAEKYPWSLMDVGHSFFIPGEKSGNKVSQKNTAYKDKRHFICGEDTVGGVVGLRVWRDK